MSGGLLELVAFGAQDIYLVGSPQVSLFKAVYRRHTNFAKEDIEQTFQGSVDFNSRVTCTLARQGDLVSGLTVKFRLPQVTITNEAQGQTKSCRWIDSLGHYLIELAEIEIGGQVIDRHSSDWLEIWSQLTVSAAHSSAYKEQIGHDGPFAGLRVPITTNVEDSVVNQGINVDANNRRLLYVPLQFWFCRNLGLSLPLIALQYHEVKVHLTFASMETVLHNGQIAPSASGQKLDASLHASFIYLDVKERRRFAQISHEYLIEQLQTDEYVFSSASARQTLNIDLQLNHPVKALFWVTRLRENERKLQWNNYTTRSVDEDSFSPNAANVTARPHPFTEEGAPYTALHNRILPHNFTESATLQLNGQNRMQMQHGSYFSHVVPLRCFYASPMSPGINVYSFAELPAEYQPTGACNFSRIDTARLVLSLRAANPDSDELHHNDTVVSAGGTVKIYAINYNVLRIMAGMAGIAYSN